MLVKRQYFSKRMKWHPILKLVLIRPKAPWNIQDRATFLCHYIVTDLWRLDARLQGRPNLCVTPHDLSLQSCGETWTHDSLYRINFRDCAEDCAKRTHTSHLRNAAQTLPSRRTGGRFKLADRCVPKSDRLPITDFQCFHVLCMCNVFTYIGK